MQSLISCIIAIRKGRGLAHTSHHEIVLAHRFPFHRWQSFVIICFEAERRVFIFCSKIISDRVVRFIHASALVLTGYIIVSSPKKAKKNIYFFQLFCFIWNYSFSKRKLPWERKIFSVSPSEILPRIQYNKGWRQRNDA